MATSGRPLDFYTRQQIVRMRAHGLSIRQVASAQHVSINTVQKYAKNQALKSDTRS